MTVKAKFICSGKFANGYNTTVNFYAVYGTEGENADYAKATPSGNISLNIDNDTKAADFFQVNESYYLTFEHTAR